ncbi:hypothetical protein [Streptomyces sp. NPDC052302]|uniref:hypothetical protein n=1 Tax=Streptomyces sp. NPDC052302 TaxID=3365688 RepID=UPI0037D168F7
MDLVMTEEYAALVVGVDIALLVVGTVQILGLLKAARADAEKVFARQDAAVRVISDRLQAGEEPTPEELEVAAELGRVRQILPTVGLLVLSHLWMVLSAALLFAVTATVFWAAIEGRGSAPLLASYTAWVTAASAVLLVVEALIQSVRLLKAEVEEGGGLDPTLYNEALAKLDEYRSTQRQIGPIQAAPDSQTPTASPAQ